MITELIVIKLIITFNNKNVFTAIKGSIYKLGSGQKNLKMVSLRVFKS